MADGYIHVAEDNIRRLSFVDRSYEEGNLYAYAEPPTFPSAIYDEAANAPLDIQSSPIDYVLPTPTVRENTTQTTDSPRNFSKYIGLIGVLGCVGVAGLAGGSSSAPTESQGPQSTSAQLEPYRCTPGTVVYTMSTIAPTGWLELNGQLVDSQRHPDLANALGKTGTFSLPDLIGPKYFIRSGRSPGVIQASSLNKADFDIEIIDRGHSHRMSDGFHTPVVNGENVWSTTLNGEGPNTKETVYLTPEEVGPSNYSNLEPHVLAGTETRPANIAMLPVICSG